MTIRRRRAPGLGGRGGWISARESFRATILATLFASIHFGLGDVRAEVSGDAVAIVDGVTISGADYQQHLTGYLRSKLYHGGSPERVRELADEALDSLIVNRLLASAAVAQGIEPDLEATESRLASIREQYSDHDDWAEIEAQFPDIEREIQKATQIQRLREKISLVEDATPAQVRSFYQSNPSLFTQPASWDLDLLMVVVDPSATAAEWIDARKKAEAAVARVSAGEPFRDVVRQVSTHSSSKQGGALGLVHRGQLPAEADAALDKIQVGELTTPTRLLEGYAVFRLNARNPALLQPFEKVEDRAEKLYRQHESNRRWTEFVESLRASAQIETFDITRHVDAVVYRP